MKPKHGRAAIRNAIRKTYSKVENYRITGELWGISEGTAWRMINEKSYWPTSPELKKNIQEIGRRVHGIVVGVRPLPKD